jgi:diacylglycerol kinase
MTDSSPVSLAPKSTLFESFGFALAGVRWLWQTQRNFRIHAAIFSLVVLLGVWLPLAPRDWAVVLTISAVVFASEALNSALEHLVDWLTDTQFDGRWTPQAKAIKDAGAAACFIAAACAVGIGLAVFMPLLLKQIRYC